MSRRKRASMREGPLSELFRSTSDDAPVDSSEGSEASAAGPVMDDSEPSRPAGPVAGGSPPAHPPEGQPSTPPGGEAPTASGPDGRSSTGEASVGGNEGSTESAPERLKRVFSEEPVVRDERADTPRYGRE